VTPVAFPPKRDSYALRQKQSELLAEVSAFNRLLGAIYQAAGDPVADVEGAFQVADTTLVDGTPLDVLRECQWTWICTPAPLGPAKLITGPDGSNTIGGAIGACVRRYTWFLACSRLRGRCRAFS
jgi:hypothetical protein